MEDGALSSRFNAGQSLFDSPQYGFPAFLPAGQKKEEQTLLGGEFAG
jgi:hypothetical protein